MGAGVSPEKFDVTYFTDSDHSIVYNKQGVYLYKQLTTKLFEEKQRKGSGGGHQWSKKAVAWRG
jgi:dipeptidyl-peptidase-4